MAERITIHLDNGTVEVTTEQLLALRAFELVYFSWHPRLRRFSGHADVNKATIEAFIREARL
jgi:hypothetical protein